jgi:Flp pilus assembly pilin Flp
MKSVGAKRQRGVTMVEYLVVAGAMVLAVLAPVPGFDKSATQLLMDAIKENHHAYMWSMSLPI